MKIFNRLKSKKGLTGADVAAAITVIVLTVGIVTAIYVNTLNKSKDNLRSANATRIATNIMENIQKKPYEYLTEVCKTGNAAEASGGTKIFDTKVPNGFKAKITVSAAGTPDIARDVVVSVTYKASTTYKTISISSVKEKELMDMTNNPDISLIPDYNPSSIAMYYYPVNKIGTEYKVTTPSDITWYDYEEGNFALVCATAADKKVGDSVTGTIYAWIPRFVSKSTGDSGIGKVLFLFGSSNYRINFNKYGSLFGYGVKLGTDLNPLPYNKKDDGTATSEYSYTSFAENDGLSGVWYNISGTGNDKKMGASQKTIQEIANDFATKTGFTLPTN